MLRKKDKDPHKHTKNYTWKIAASVAAAATQ